VEGRSPYACGAGCNPQVSQYAEGRANGLSLRKSARLLILVEEVHKTGKLPVVNFAAGGWPRRLTAALMMQLGAEGVFVGSGIFKSSDPVVRAEANR